MNAQLSDSEALGCAVDAVYADSDAMWDIVMDMGLAMHPESVMDTLNTLADASWMLAQLFDNDITVAQLFEQQKAYPERIQALRDLLRLARETDLAIADKVTERAREMVEGVA